MSYATTERKRVTKAKVDGGSSIEIISAGAKDGNVGKVIINGKEVMTAKNLSSDIKLKSATMSSNYRKGDLNTEASIALDGNDATYFHTKCGADEWWSAGFGEGKFLVTEVHIHNRKSGDDATIERLAKSEITIEGQYCGKLPDKTPAYKGDNVYKVVCERPVAGHNIMIRNTQKKCLHFAGIRVVGKAMDP